MHAALDGRVFGRQAEGVEAHRKQHVVSLHALETRARVRRRHGVPVADVQVAARIRQHGQRVVLGPGRVDRGPVQLVRFPFGLPLLLHARGVVAALTGGGRNFPDGRLFRGGGFPDRPGLARRGGLRRFAGPGGRLLLVFRAFFINYSHSHLIEIHRAIWIYRR
jgi:hypothetical protein